MEKDRKVLNILSKGDIYEVYVVMVACGTLVTLLGIVIESKTTLIAGVAMIGLIVIVLIICWLYAITLALGK